MLDFFEATKCYSKSDAEICIIFLINTHFPTYTECYRRTNKNLFLELQHLIYKESIRLPLQVYF